MKKSNRVKAGTPAKKSTRRLPGTPLSAPAQETVAERLDLPPRSPDESNSNEEVQVTVSLPYSTPPGYPTTIKALQSAANLFLHSFPDSLKWHDVSGYQLLCGLRAISKSLKIQYGIDADFEELCTIAGGGALWQREYDTVGFSSGSTNNFSADELYLVLTIWCENHGKTAEDAFCLGWLTLNGHLTIYGQRETATDMKVVWIYSNFDGFDNDQKVYHYQGLGRAVPDETLLQVTSSDGAKLRKRSATATNAVPIERLAKKRRLEDDPQPLVQIQTRSSSRNVSCFVDEKLEDRAVTLEDPVDLDNDDINGNTDDVVWLEFDSRDEKDDEQQPSIPPAENQGDEHIIRVGRQPIKCGDPSIIGTSETRMKRILGDALKRAAGTVDAKLPGATPDSVEENSKLCLECLMASFDRPSGHFVSRYCDYTGLSMQTSTGPGYASLEAVLPFATTDGRVVYHAPQNIALIQWSLNMMKGPRPILVLPLLSAWINTFDTPRFETQKSLFVWVYRALVNATTLIYLYGVPGRGHFVQAQLWETWSVQKQEAVLELFRTGTASDMLVADLDQVNPWKLLRIGVPAFDQSSRWYLDPRERSDWERFYRQLQKIAKRYGLTAAEFEYYCTVKSPEDGAGPVFYPFHILSRSQAEARSWDWNAFLRLATFRLARMRKECNKHGEKAGYGEAQMDGYKLIYWLAHHTCHQIQHLKVKLKGAAQEKIRFYILDRWGFPCVPWVLHPFVFSLCKKDHGIAMLFGLVCPEGEPFDPVEHFDLNRCTITVDALMTNMGMWNFEQAAWDGIRESLRHVPLNHPFWSVDSQLGQDIWNDLGDPDREETPMAPLPEFDIDLVPLDSANAHFPRQCQVCSKSLSSAGSLIRHYREQHSRAVHPAGTASHKELNDHQHCPSEGGPKPHQCGWPDCVESFDERSALTEHEKTHVLTEACDWPGCKFSTKLATILKTHKMIHTDEKPFVCDWPGCEYSARRADVLKTHKMIHTGETPFVCDWPECNYSTRSASYLKSHKLIHAGEKPFVCDWPGCEYSATQSNTLAEHKLTHTDEKPFVCDWPGCEYSARRADALKTHKTVHTGEKPFVCDWPGCEYSARRADSLKKHKMIHTGEKPFVCDWPGCEYSTRKADVLKTHKMIHTGEKPFVCDWPGCEYSARKANALKTHKKKEHEKKKGGKGSK